LKTDYQGAVIIDGSVPCLICGYGEECALSGFTFRHGPGAKITPESFYNFDQDEKAKKAAIDMGRALKKALAKQRN
jgi:hypothetical protein